jgi:hypothetical protein
LKGTAITGAEISISPATITFNGFGAGEWVACGYQLPVPIPTADITIQSTGVGTAVINRVVVSGTFFDLSEQPGSCVTAGGAGISPGKNCDIVVQFLSSSTTAPSTWDGTLTIYDNTDASPHTVPLIGNALQCHPPPE